MPRRVEDFRGLTHLSRLRLLASIQEERGQTVRELAQVAGLHVNTAREHLRVLEREGLVHSRPAVTGHRGRPPATYFPVEDMTENEVARDRVGSASAHGDLLRAVSPELDRTAQHGEAAAHQIDTLYQHLEDAGFEPEVDEQDLAIDLSPCRYLRSLGEDPRSVCAAHLQLVRTQLRQVTGPVEVERIEPFIAPDRCRISLTLRPAL